MTTSKFRIYLDPLFIFSIKACNRQTLAVLFDVILSWVVKEVNLSLLWGMVCKVKSFLVCDFSYPNHIHATEAPLLQAPGFVSSFSRSE